MKITVGSGNAVKVAREDMSRKLLIVQNDSGSAASVYWSFDDKLDEASDATAGVELQPGENVTFGRNQGGEAGEAIYCRTASGTATVRVTAPRKRL